MTASGGALAVCLVALWLVTPLNVSGRLGSINPEFYLSHLGTLVGRTGPSAGSIEHRVELTSKAINELTSGPLTPFVGVGLGPDLAFGFRAGGSDLVRKPHNDFLEVLVRLGLVGAGLFIWILVALIKPILRTARSKSDQRSQICVWVLGTATLYLLIAATQPLLAYPFGAVPLFFFLGLGAGLALNVELDKPQDEFAPSDPSYVGT